jgi:trimethylamine--corrinoid protein Co-methyltransferase
MKIVYEILSRVECERIHAAALQVVEQIGMTIHDGTICQKLQRAGLPVAPNGRVTFPAAAVAAACQAAPHTFRMNDRLGRAIDIENGNTLPAVYANAIKILDYPSREIRPSLLKDLTDSVRLADAIPECRVVCPVCQPTDLPEDQALGATILAVLGNSTKLVEVAPQTGREARAWIEAAAIAEAGCPNSGGSLLLTASPTSPRQIDPHTCDVMQASAAKNIPLLLSPCPMAGGTSPYTMAGTLVQTHAEFLGMLVVSQTLRVGLPVLYGGSAGVMDLRSGALSYGLPERNTLLSANIDLANFLGLPHFSSSGTVDSAGPDYAAGAQKALAWMTRLLKGSIFGIWFGSLLTGSAVSAEQIVMDASLYRSIVSMLQGVRLDDDRLAVEAICRVGPGGGFLTDAHTRRWMRSDEYAGLSRGSTRLGSSVDPIDQAHEQVETILAKHQPQVPEGVRSNIERYIQENY